MSGTQRARRDDPLDGTPWEAVIGLEVHAQLLTRTKMFSPCEARFGAEPNTLTCPVTIGLPGSLPVVNRRAVELAIRVGCALGSRIAERTKFDRKHYFYPDLPKGYQISQYDAPIASGGEVEYFDGDEKKKVRLVRAHLEEDAGKNIHVDARPESWVDLNRAGTPLLEIVTEPDLRTPAETVAFVRMLRSILLSLDVCDGNMEEGSFRCDVNVSIRPRGATHLETRTEIKNLNSFTHIEHALRYEILRQKKLKERGGEVVQETRLYDVARDETRGMRGKEEAHDYRYFPEPDLAPLRIDPQWVASIRSSLPELPLARFERFEREGLSTYQADIISRDRALADFFDAAVASYEHPRNIANWVINALLEELNTRSTDIQSLGLSPARFAELVRAVDSGVVSAQKAKELFRAMIGNDRDVKELAEELGLVQISDESFLREVVEKVIAAHPGPVADVRAGKEKSIHFLVGQVMRESRGQANPGRAAELLREAIG